MRREIWLQPNLNIETHLSLILTQIFLFAPFQLSNQETILSRKKYWSGDLPPPPLQCCPVAIELTAHHWTIASLSFETSYWFHTEGSKCP